MSEDVSIRIKGDPSGGVAAFEKVGAAGASAMQRISQANASISEGAARLTGVVTGLATSLAAGAFMSGVKTQIDLADAMDESAQKAGVATSAFSELAYVGRFAGLETDSLVKVLNKVTDAAVKVASGDEKMKSLFADTLQVDVRNAAGQMRNADQVLMDLIDRLSGISDQSLRTAAAMEIFGDKLGPQLLPLINLTRSGVEGLREEAKRLGVTISDEAGAAAGDLKDNLDRLRASQEGLYNQMMTQMLPGLLALSQRWLDNNRNAGLFRGTLVTLGQAMKEALGLGEMAEQGRTAQAAAAQVRRLVSEMERLQEVIKDNPRAMVEQGYGAPAISAGAKLAMLRQEYARTMAMAMSASNQLKGTADSRDGSGKTAAAGGAAGAAAGGGGGAGVGDAGMLARIQAQEQEQRKKAEKEEQQAMKAVAAEKRRLAAERTREQNEERKRQRDLYEDKVGQLRLELAQWRNNTGEQLRIAEQIAQAAKVQFGAESQEFSAAQQEILRIRQRSADQHKQIDAELRAAQANASLAAVALAQQEADHAVALGTMTVSTRLGLEQGFEAQITAIKRQALQERLQLLESDPDLNPVERARIHQEIEELERAHNARKAELGNAKGREDAAPAMETLDSFEQTLEAQSTRLIMRQQSVMDTLKNLWSSASTAFVQELVTKPVVAWIASQARMTAASIMGVQTRTAAEATGAATSTAITAASVVKQIAMRAWAVAAGVYAALASIPYIGPFIAPAAAIAATAVVLGFARNVFSAEGGFDIPAGVNPMVQAHAKEMILPAKYADVIRSMADGGGGGGEGGGTINLSVQTMDARSFQTWLRGEGGQAIVQELALRQRSRRVGG